MYLSLNLRWPLLFGNHLQNCSSPSSNLMSSSNGYKALPSSCPPSSVPAMNNCLKETVVSSPPSLPAPSASLMNTHYQGLCQQYGAGPLDQVSQMNSMAALKDSASTHPAFPVNLPLLFPHGPSAASPYNFNHLQQLFARERTIHQGQYSPEVPAMPKSFMDFGRMAGHLPFGKKLFGCPQCRYRPLRKNNLKRHVATMHQECDKVLECCGVVFKNKASLRDHVLIFHSNGYMCRYCGRNFCRKALLKRHLTVHSGQKDYVCTMCDYATSHKSNLERHKKVHDRQVGEGEGEMLASPSSHNLEDYHTADVDRSCSTPNPPCSLLTADLPRSLAAHASHSGADSGAENGDDDPSTAVIDVVDLAN